MSMGVFVIAYGQLNTINMILFQLFCHVSTSYCHLNEKFLLEKPYKPPVDPHCIIKSIEHLKEDVVHSMSEQYVDLYLHSHSI